MSEDWRSSAGTPGTILSIMQIVKKPNLSSGQRSGPYVGGRSNRGAQRGPHPPSPSGSEVCVISLIMTRMLSRSCMDESHHCHPDFLQGTLSSPVICKVLALVENLPREGRIGQQPSGMVCHFIIFDILDLI